ncbi:hypothetical protein [Euzebyella saccharophila]|uniref:Fibronectin type-III domain-containing protein n=1 Tax=Euzebyella saccharophila TaxID=679664 RepID=A0ABV8JQD2_9FLAO|nr:hypothetical protein [Euzebyella saccharophila]
MRLLRAIFCILLVSVGCKKDDPNPPAQATLVAPAKNAECSPVQSTNGTSSVVRFNWQASEYTDSYQLRVTNLLSGITQSPNTTSTTHTLSLSKGTPYSWQVISSNTKSSKTASSETWFFYNPGSQTTHVPFPAQISSPEPGSSVFRDINNEVTLEWSGSDIDDDISGYEIYFSTANPPTELLASVNSTVHLRSVSVEVDQVYFWQVVTTDSQGNVSKSPVVDFKSR